MSDKFNILYVLLALLLHCDGQVDSEAVVCNGDASRCKYTSLAAAWERAETLCREQGARLPDDTMMDDPAFIDVLKFRKTWTSSKTGANNCTIYKSDKNGSVRRKPADCRTKKPYICVFPPRRTSGSGKCPSDSWTVCPKSKIAVEVGSNVTLQCSHADEFSECEWRLRGWIYRSSLITFPSDPKVTVRNAHTCELNIPVVREEHFGVWNCQGHQHDFLNVTIMQYRRPSPPLLRINDVLSGTAKLAEYSNANASCESQHGTGVTKITMKLEKGEDTLALSTLEVSEETDEDRLISRAVLPSGVQLRRFHGGLLVCTLHHQKGELTQTAGIQVMYSPEMQSRPSELWGEIGKGLRQVFIFSANPMEAKDVYLNINTPSQEDGRLHPEELMENYYLGPLVSSNTELNLYSVELVVQNLQWNNTLYNHTLVLKNPLGRLETTFTLKSNTPKLTEMSRSEARNEPSTEEASSTHAGAAGFFCILIFVVGASAFVYLFLHQRRKEKRREDTEEEKDPRSDTSTMRSDKSGHSYVYLKGRSGSATDDELYTMIPENEKHALNPINN